MDGPVQATVSELPGSRVRVNVRVAPAALDAGVERTARRLGRELKLPGFRKGKVPAQLVLRRVGREAVLEETVREGLPDWYAEAIRVSRIVPVGDPSIDLGELPAGGDALQFSIEIGVLPTAELGPYTGLEVARREPQVSDEQIEREIEAVRERLARLETVERPAGRRDYVVVDYAGRVPRTADADAGGAGGAGGADETTLVAFEGGEGRDQLIELGAGELISGFEEGLLGARAGETRTIDVSFPGDYANEELAGRNASFEIAVKQVKAKRLPEIDEDFAADAGFDDVQELRDDIARRLLDAQKQEVREEFRQAALDAAVAGASVPVTGELARARAQEMWERMLHSLSHRGVSREAYLRISGRREEEILAEMTPEAERALRREAVLTAIVAAANIEPSDQELLELLRPVAERESIAPERALERLRADGRIEELREDLAVRQAIDLIVSSAIPIPVEKARAREKLWTPDKDAEEDVRHEGGRAEERALEHDRLWTPTR
jgi:trigger factor